MTLLIGMERKTMANAGRGPQTHGIPAGEYSAEHAAARALPPPQREWRRTRGHEHAPAWAARIARPWERPWCETVRRPTPECGRAHAHRGPGGAADKRRRSYQRKRACPEGDATPASAG